MKTLQCDRCKLIKPLSESDKFREVDISGMLPNRPYLSVDLCEDCIKLLHQFLKGDNDAL